MGEVKRVVEIPVDIKSTKPMGYRVIVRRTEYPAREIGIIAEPTQEIKERFKREGLPEPLPEAIYIRTDDLRRLVEKLEEISKEVIG